MQNLDPTGQYTNDEVKAALSGSGGSRDWEFRYERLLSDNAYVEDIDFVQSCTISNNAFADIKRTAKFSLLDTGNINYLSDRIKPYVRLNMPKDKTNRRGYVEWPQGVFLLSSPSRSMEEGATVTREVEAYDQLLALKESSFDYRYSIRKGANCVLALQDLISDVTRRNIVLNPNYATASNLSDTNVVKGTGSTPAISWNTSMKTTGIRSRQFAVTSPHSGWTTNTSLNIDPQMARGRTVHFAFKVRPAVTGATAQPTAEFGGLGKNTAGTKVTLTAGEWTIVRGKVFMPDVDFDEATVGINMTYGATLSQTIYVDSGIAELDRQTGEFFDGSTTSSQGDGMYAWVGAANASASVATSKAYNITPNTAVFKEAIEWEPGTTKLAIINDILGYINYESAWYDENGVFIGRPYVSPTLRGSEFTYATDADSVILDTTISQELDLFSVPNKWILVVSNPESVPMVATYTNNNPLSPTSTVARGREIVDYRTEQEASDQATLNAKAERLAFEASQVYEQVSFSTGLMPFHSNNDVYTLVVDGLATNSKYSESSWDMSMESGSAMAHKIRKITDL